MPVGKESIMRAANAGVKKTVKAEAKTTTKTTVRRKTVKKSVVSTQDAEKVEQAFATEDKKGTIKGPVHINEELPVYLL